MNFLLIDVLSLWEIIQIKFLRSVNLAAAIDDDKEEAPVPMIDSCVCLRLSSDFWFYHFKQ